MKLSIVVTLYQSATYLAEFHRRASAAAQERVGNDLFKLLTGMNLPENIVTARLMTRRYVDGWTSVMASIWLLGAMIISFIGVVGIYLSKIFSGTKQRPYTIVRQVHGKR
ncbi:hypothetical protein [Pseudomonas purpurea]|uniref:hypothetical protein n=1 Tax=Pseudomonas purpurea TaxID=3136737 RepID=UPI003263B663